MPLTGQNRGTADLNGTAMSKKKEIIRTGDLAPLGIRSTVRGIYGFRETFEHIFKEANKPDPEWKRFQKR